jgi:hypothetical protein
VVRVTLDDSDFAKQLPAGAMGAAAIFTEARQDCAHHPQGASAAGVNSELRQSVLNRAAAERPRMCTKLSHLSRTRQSVRAQKSGLFATGMW